MKYYFRLIILTISLLVYYESIYAQKNRHIVYFSDKHNNAYSLTNPSTFLTDRAITRRSKQNINYNNLDLPVSAIYIDSLSKLPLKILNRSKWLNAVLIENDSETDSLIPQILELTFVSKITKVAEYKSESTKQSLSEEEAQNGIWKVWEEREYGATSFQTKQMNGDFLHKQGYNGNEMLIAIIDAGFNKANEMLCFNHIYNEKKLVATRNFLNKETNPIYSLSNHGTHVFSIMAGRVEGSYYGASPEASYILLVTEDITSEQMVEEFNYVVALEYADSLGVDVVNTSLGYFSYDNDLNSHAPDNLDGKTAISSIASNIAARKGMLIVSSAGNEGASEWKYITVPSDADSGLSVGAVDVNGNKIPFSSEGYEKFSMIKPNVVALGRTVAIVNNRNEIVTGSGTSYSSPIVAGLAACLWQAYPQKTNMEIFQAIEKSSSQFFNPDLQLGYGIPNFEIAYRILSETPFEPSSDKAISIYPNPASNFININFYENFNEIIFTLYNPMGKTIYSQKLNINGRISVSLPVQNLQISNSGIYFIRIDSQSGSYVQKIYINP